MLRHLLILPSLFTYTRLCAACGKRGGSKNNLCRECNVRLVKFIVTRRNASRVALIEQHASVGR
jgi:hypothetical protein